MRASKKLMNWDNTIWSRQGWQHAGMVDKKIYRKELKAFVGQRKFSEKTYDVLEDQNYHTLNAQLGKLNRFKEKRLNIIGKKYG
jgi:hypothetical protein